MLQSRAAMPKSCARPKTSLAADAKSVSSKAKKSLVKSSNSNAGQRAKTLKIAKYYQKPRKSPTRDLLASHTRSQGKLPDPPVRLQHPRLRTEEPRFAVHEGRFHCGAFEEERKGVPLRLSPASLRESTLPGGGIGVFVREDVPDKTVILEYGGEVITMEEAKRRQIQVIAFVFISFANAS